MEQLAEDFKGQFQCVEENMEKYITFSVLIKKKNVMMVKQLRTN